MKGRQVLVGREEPVTFALKCLNSREVRRNRNCNMHVYAVKYIIVCVVSSSIKFLVSWKLSF